MPYKDSARRRDYDKAYKRRQRAQGLTKKWVDNRLTEAKFETAEDLRDLLNEVIAETQNAEGQSLRLEAKLRLKLRAVEIGLRVVEITDHERRLAALEEQDACTDTNQESEDLKSVKLVKRRLRRGFRVIPSCSQGSWA